MHNRNTNLVLQELPPRAENLSEVDVKNIFGGCGRFNQSCDKHNDCCPGYDCDAFANKCGIVNN